MEGDTSTPALTQTEQMTSNYFSNKWHIILAINFVLLAIVLGAYYYSKHTPATPKRNVVVELSPSLVGLRDSLVKERTPEAKKQFLDQTNKYFSNLPEGFEKLQHSLLYYNVLARVYGVTSEEEKNKNIKAAVSGYAAEYRKYKDDKTQEGITSKGLVIYEFMKSFIESGFDKEYLRVITDDKYVDMKQVFRVVRQAIDNKNFGYAVNTDFPLYERMYIDAVYLDSFAKDLNSEEKTEVVNRIKEDLVSVKNAQNMYPDMIVYDKYLSTMYQAYAYDVMNRHGGEITAQKSEEIDKVYDAALEYLNANRNKSLENVAVYHGAVSVFYINSIFLRKEESVKDQKIKNLIGGIKNDFLVSSAAQNRLSRFITLESIPTLSWMASRVEFNNIATSNPDVKNFVSFVSSSQSATSTKQ